MPDTTAPKSERPDARLARTTADRPARRTSTGVRLDLPGAARMHDLFLDEPERWPGYAAVGREP